MPEKEPQPVIRNKEPQPVVRNREIRYKCGRHTGGHDRAGLERCRYEPAEPQHYRVEYGVDDTDH